MKYADRNGNQYQEETGQDRLLKLMYNSTAGRAGLKLLVRPLVSKAGGVFLGSSLSRRMIEPFIRRNRIDMSEYMPESYRSYNDFFTRKIRPGMRPAAEGEDAVITPCDGKLSVMRVQPDSRFMIKGREYTTEQLLKSRFLADKFAGGFLFVIRLTVDNYHRYCYPVSGIKSAQKVIPGVYHTVNPAACELVSVYAENHREFCLIRSESAGTMLQMEVGALMVGRITNYVKESCDVLKGQEKGKFEFGGSTVILMFRPGSIRVDDDLIKNTEQGCETIVKMGEQIARGLHGAED